MAATLTPKEERVIRDLRMGINGVIGGIPEEEDDRRNRVLVHNKAVDVELLLDVIDKLRGPGL